jgi:hypothetical protein
LVNLGPFCPYWRDGVYAAIRLRSATILAATTRPRELLGMEEAMNTKRCTNQKSVKLADLDWKKYYDKQAQEKLLAGLEI